MHKVISPNNIKGFILDVDSIFYQVLVISIDIKIENMSRILFASVLISFRKANHRSPGLVMTYEFVIVVEQLEVTAAAEHQLIMQPSSHQ